MPGRGNHRWRRLLDGLVQLPVTVNHWYFRRVLSESRSEWRDSRQQLLRDTMLSAEQRKLLTPILRRNDVLYVAHNTPSIYLATSAVGVLTLMLLCFATPPIVVLLTGLPTHFTPSQYIIAAAAYSIGFTLLGLIYLAVRHFRQLLRKTIQTALVAILAALITVGDHYDNLDTIWQAAQAAGIAMAIAIPLVFIGDRLRRMWLVWRADADQRRLGFISPLQSVALMLTYDHYSLNDARHSWHLPLVRASLVTGLHDTAEIVENDLWFKARAAFDITGPVLHKLRQQCGEAAAAIRDLQLRMLHVSEEPEFLKLCNDVAQIACGAACGSWTLLQGEYSEPAPSRGRMLVRRMLPAAALIGTAIGLRYLPGVAAADPALTSIQIGLVVAAILSLLPIDDRHREAVLGAVRDSTKARQ